MQQTLQGKGYYHGEVDGVFGLRTRANSGEHSRTSEG
jgi:peptidoglycan hydrolase-like protein with peptidoglycan-binding domain